MNRVFLKFLTPLLVAVLMFGGVICSRAASSDSIDPLSSWVTYSQWKDKDGNWHEFDEDMCSLVKNMLDYLEESDVSSFFAYDGYISSGYHRYILSASAAYHICSQADAGGYGLLFVDKRSDGEFALGNSYWYEICLYDDGSVTYSTSAKKSYSALIVDEVLASKKEIYADINRDEIFFQPTEPPVLATAVAPVNLTKVLDPVMQILPIGLACLVSFVGLRKGLDLLRRMLYQA